MEASFQNLSDHFESLYQEYQTKKDDVIEAEWLKLFHLVNFTKRKIQMRREIASETLTNMTQMVNILFGLESHVTTVLAKTGPNKGDSEFLSSLNPLRCHVEYWPPKTHMAAHRALETMEAGLIDLAFYFNLYKEDLKFFVGKFTQAKCLCSTIRNGLKLEELMVLSGKANVCQLQKVLMEFEITLASVDENNIKAEAEIH